MNNMHVEYDFKKLQQISEIIINENELQTLGDLREYYDKLTAFTENSAHYLDGFDPLSVFSRDDVRKNFLNALKETRTTLTMLGMAASASELMYIENAALRRDSTAMEHELSVFKSNMESISERIISARVQGYHSAANQDSKPVILAVDDMPALLSTVVKMLRDKFTVVAVTSGQAALKALEKHTPALFLLDIEMPQMDGYRLASLIRKRENFALTPIIFLTAKSARNDVVTAIMHGGNDYIIKPVDKELLIEKIMRQIE